jgi:hypothetical protein
MRFLSTVYLTVALASIALAGDWPQWRGPTGDGRSDETAFSTTWSDTESLSKMAESHRLSRRTIR